MATRVAAMREALAAIEAHKVPLVNLLIREQGKPINNGALGEFGMCTGLLAKWCALTEADLLKDVYKDTAAVRIEVRRRAIGVIACITPWNYPLFCSIQKWAPAIMLGNAAVVKPSPMTPLTALAVGELVAGAFPPGVLNVIGGDDAGQPFNVGAHLTSHPGVDKVSFTGSIRTGKAIFAAAAPDVKRVTLEMGGNDPAIVRADCDPAAAAQGVFNGAFGNTGQVCCAIKRVFVHESIYSAFCAEIAKCAETGLQQTGDGFHENTKYGPLNNKMQFDRVCELVDDAVARGATVLAGGKPGLPKGSANGGSAEGYFYEPTILTGLKEGVRIVDEEQFGPALPVMSYKTDEEALARANGTKFGLGGSVWSTDVAAANALAQRIQSGTVWVNRHMDITGAPFGGFKWSGVGRELGKADLDTFSESQTLMLAK